MRIIRSERNAAILLLAAALLGLFLANSPVGTALFEVVHTHLGVPGFVDLTVHHWISDGLLAVFFFIVAVELKYELTKGALADRKRAAVPALAALGGVAVPALVYVAIAGPSGLAAGWPVPTATDIAFALGVLALVGRALPSAVRVFLLALAVLDDLVAIVIIAIFFTSELNFAALGGAIVCLAAAAVVSRLSVPRARHLPTVCVIVLGIAAWSFTLNSGVHATIAGVALGLVIAARPAERAAHELQPYSNGVILPLFAFTAAMVVLPEVGPSELSPAFWGITIALPVGKLVGVILVGWGASRLLHRDRSDALPLGDLIAVGSLAGIGFTVSLLMNELAFTDNPAVADQGTLAVLVGSLCSAVIAVIVVRIRVRQHKRARQRESVRPRAETAR